MKNLARALVLGCLALGACQAGPLDAVTIDPAILTVGQVAHWTFDDGAGTVVVDQSRNGHDGQLTGGTWMPAGRFGGALELAQNAFVMVPNFPQATPSWTVSLWIRMSAEQLALGKGQDDFLTTIISTENVFAGGWQMHVDHRTGFDRFDVAYWAGSTVNDYVVASCQCIEVDRWIHLTAVFDGAANQLFFYRDDQIMDKRPMPMPILAGDPTLYIGTWNMANRFLTAEMDDVAIWNRALDRAEIGVLSAQPAPTPP